MPHHCIRYGTCTAPCFHILSLYLKKGLPSVSVSFHGLELERSDVSIQELASTSHLYGRLLDTYIGTV